MTAPYETPLFLEALPGDSPVTYGGRQFRTLVDAAYSSAGVLSAGAWQVTQHAAGASFQVDVAAGMGVVAGTAAVNLGKFLERTVATTSVTIAPAPSSGSRTDLIVAQVHDPQSDTSAPGVYGFEFLPIQGPDSNGTVPQVPANALLLAQVTVPAGAASIATAQITDLRALAQGVGARGYWFGTRTINPNVAAMSGSVFAPVSSWAATDSTVGISCDGTVWTVAQAGWYRVRGQIAYGPDTTGQRTVRLYMAGETVHESQQRVDGTYNTQLHFFGNRHLNAGDQLYVGTYHTQGATTQFALGPGQFHIEIERR